MDAVHMNYKPEFLNRLDDIVMFHPLTREELGGIVDIQVKGVAQRLTDRRITLDVTDSAREWLANTGYDPAYGARPLRRLVQTEVGDQLAHMLLAGKVNSVISSCETAKSIIERQGRLSEKCIDLVTNKKLGTSTLQTLTSSLDLVMLNNTRLISLSRTILSTSVKMNDSERLAVLQEIERQTIEQERKVSKVSRIISQYERLKRNLR